MPHAVSGKLNIHYETRGEGPPLLMLMGWQGNRTWWPESLLSRLETHAQLILMDHRGTGHSSDSGGLYTLLDLARDALSVLDILDIEQADVLGVSMGGMVSQELALSYPERVRRLVLISTTANPRSLFRITRKQRQAWLGYLRRRDRTPREFMLDLLFSRDCKTDPPPQMKSFVRRVTALPTSGKTALQQYIAIQRFNSRPRLNGLERPTLVLSGTDDLMIPMHHSRELHHGIPNARLHEIVGGSHAMLDAAAEELTRVIVEFLREQ